MNRSAFKLLAVLLLASLGALTGCDVDDADGDSFTTCSAGAAAIGVSDGLIAPLCGCTGVADGWQGFDTGINCTVSAGTTVHFYFLGTTLKHQILTTTASADSFAPSGVSDPKDSRTPRVHSVTLSTGTYTFTDAFDSRLSSVITVL